MALYLVQHTYTAESVAAQIKNPQDRTALLTSAIEALGGRVVGIGFTSGPPGIVSLLELPDDQAAAGANLAVFATGAFGENRITPLLSGEEWAGALASANFPQYTAPL
jgi:uncharacterized protein with GYD domain